MTPGIRVCLLAVVFLMACSSDDSNPVDTNHPDVIRPDLSVQDDGADDLGTSNDPGKPDTGPLDDGPLPTDDGPQDDGAVTLPDIPLKDNPYIPDFGGDAEALAPKVKVVPAVIDFGFVQKNQTSKVPISVANVGTAALAVEKFILDGPPEVELFIGYEPKTQKDGTRLYTTTDAGGNPIVLKPGERFDGTEKFIKFSPSFDEAVYASIKVYTNDPEYPDGYEIFVMGNKSRPEISLAPGTIEFGPVVIDSPSLELVEIRSTGKMDVQLYQIGLDSAATQAGYEVMFNAFPGGVAPTISSPVTVSSGDVISLGVRYNPQNPSPTDAIGKPLDEPGQVIIQSNIFDGSTILPVNGFSVTQACAQPVIAASRRVWVQDLNPETPEEWYFEYVEVLPDETIPSGSLVLFSGEYSFSPFGEVDSWDWRADQPGENGAFYVPDSTNVRPSFMVGAPGEYVFHVDVTDDQENETCPHDGFKVIAEAENKATILLSWKPIDPDATNPTHTGPDVDLHLVHPSAYLKSGGDYDNDGLPDGWYDDPYDCFWYNNVPPKAVWGTASPWVEDRVLLMYDSMDGAGPEVITVQLEGCPAGREYHIGAHFFDDHGYGDVIATLQVFVGGSKVLETTANLKNLDMWDMARLRCSTSGSTHSATAWSIAGPDIVPNYVNPSFAGP